MRISSGLRSFGSRVPTESQGGGAVQRAEVVADLFNNPLAEEEGRRDVKLRLSHASRRLQQGLRQEIDVFLKDNPDTATLLDQVELPTNVYSRADPNSQPVRKVSAYLHWLRIHKSRTDEPGESEQTYIAVHEQEKDEELQGIVTAYEEQRKSMREERTNQAPSYYYRAYPEAYSFN